MLGIAIGHNIFPAKYPSEVEGTDLLSSTQGKLYAFKVDPRFSENLPVEQLIDQQVKPILVTASRTLWQKLCIFLLVAGESALYGWGISQIYSIHAVVGRVVGILLSVGTVGTVILVWKRRLPSLYIPMWKPRTLGLMERSPDGELVPTACYLNYWFNPYTGASSWVFPTAEQCELIETLPSTPYEAHPPIPDPPLYRWIKIQVPQLNKTGTHLTGTATRLAYKDTFSNRIQFDRPLALDTDIEP